MANGREGGLFLIGDPQTYAWRAEIMSMAVRYHLPTACDQLWWGKAGCLISYAEDESEWFRRAAAQLVKIFNGTKPADIPIEQTNETQTRYEREDS